MKKKVFFISKISEPSKKGSSVDIMTNNILLGMSQTDIQMTLIMVCDDKTNKEKTREYYKRFTADIVFVPSFFSGKQNKYLYSYRLLKYILCNKKYDKVIKKLCSDFTCPQTIIVNKVSSDELFYGIAFKKIFTKAKVYQYWTDPFTLNGIDIESYKSKYLRHFYKPIEKKILRCADRNIYGTKILMEEQKKFFPQCADNMTYVDVAFVPQSQDNFKNEKKTNTVLYAGNFYKSTRNIVPLLEAISHQEKYTLDIYGSGDVTIAKTNNVFYKERISYEALKNIQDTYDIRVCILNHSTFQIPGKVFYDAMCDAKILIIADGKYASRIVEYLKGYGRYSVCNNEKEEILSALNKITEQEWNFEYIEKTFSPKKISLDILDGGIFGKET